MGELSLPSLGGWFIVYLFLCANLLSHQVRELCTLPALSIHSAIVAQRAAPNTYALRHLVLQLVLYDRVVAHLALRHAWPASNSAWLLVLLCSEWRQRIADHYGSVLACALQTITIKSPRILHKAHSLSGCREAHTPRMLTRGAPALIHSANACAFAYTA